MLICVIMMIMMLLLQGSAECDHGDVRLVNGDVPNEGRVEVCACSQWGTVCDDQWGENDAEVVCRQLGYRPDGARAFSRAYFGQGSGQAIVLDNVRCDSSEMALLQCNHNGLFIDNCDHGEDAGVECSDVEEKLLYISVDIMNVHTVSINWELQNITLHQPSSYKAECFSEVHRIEMSVNNATFNIQLAGLLPSTLYNCCVSAVYGSYVYTSRRACTEIAALIPSSTTPGNNYGSSSSVGTTPGNNYGSSSSVGTTPGNNYGSSSSVGTTPGNNYGSSSSVGTTPGSNYRSSGSAETIGGVLGFIIVLLLILLAVSGAALVYLLRPRFLNSIIPKRPSQPVVVNSRDVKIIRNLSYGTTPSHSITSGPQGRATDHSEAGAVAEYSRIGPTYETIDSRRQQQEVAGRSQVAARLSERYEFCEAHLAAAGSADVPGPGEVSLDYEVPLSSTQNEEHEDYSHLQH